MNTTEQQSLLAIALMAAFADGHKADAERDTIRQLAESLGQSPGGAALAGMYQDVLLKRRTLASEVVALSDPAHRQLAYEMAVCVCEADGQKTAAEAAFLAELKSRLDLGTGALERFEQEEAALVRATQPLPAVPSAVAVPAAATAVGAVAAQPASAELDKSILNQALLCGALELLPQSWASMAIIPLQVRMVYNIGKAHGVELDQGHIREFIATVGVGLTSQYLEQFGRKLIGGLLGKAAGRTLGGVGRAATGMAFSFATTYALGQVAKRYYAGGRVMSTDVLRQTYQDLLGPARQMQQQYLPQMQQKASTLDAGQIMALVQGR